MNKTPFCATLFPTIGMAGDEGIGVVGKATFSLGGGLSLCADQVGLTFADQYREDPSATSLLNATDFAPEKVGTDIVLIGSAHASRGAVAELDVSLEVGPMRKTVRIIGDRTWRGALGLRVAPSKPQLFSAIPLIYERAFGGRIGAAGNGAKSTTEPLNPVGRGLPQTADRGEAKETLLPNLEDPANLITSPWDRPEPAGFGFIAPHWKWRRQYAGTYDEKWAETRCPLLPNDFDPRFHSAAHPDLVSATPLRGGEPVRITNASPKGTLTFNLPRVDVQAEFVVDGKVERKACVLDTVVIEPDEERVSLTWRARTGCHRKIKYVQGVKLTSVGHDRPR